MVITTAVWIYPMVLGAVQITQSTRYRGGNWTPVLADIGHACSSMLKSHSGGLDLTLPFCDTWRALILLSGFPPLLPSALSLNALSG